MSADETIPSTKKQRQSHDTNLQPVDDGNPPNDEDRLKLTDLFFVEDAEGDSTNQITKTVTHTNGIERLEEGGAPAPSEVVICRYFLMGSCAFGDSCRYAHPSSYTKISPVNKRSSHHQSTPAGALSARTVSETTAVEREGPTQDKRNISTRPSESPSTPVCRFHGSLRGCKSGNSCPFVHLDLPKKPFVPSRIGNEGETILSKYSSVKIAEKAGVEAFTRSGNPQ